MSCLLEPEQLLGDKGTVVQVMAAAHVVTIAAAIDPVKDVLDRSFGAIQVKEEYCMADETSEAEVLLGRASAGDSIAWGALLTTHQQRLARMVAFRMDPRLSGRLDP